MPDGLVTSIEEAFVLAESEVGEAIPTVDEEAAPALEDEILGEDEQAPLAEDEQPTEEEATQEDELFDDELLAEATVEKESVPDAHDLPGYDKPVTLQELKDGYLRHGDYTKKTQELAADRKQHADAVKFWEALQANPGAVVKQLAVKVGLAADDGTTPEVDVPTFRTQSEVEAEIERRVGEKLEEHPEVRQARVAEARRVVDDEFTRIEGEYGVALGPKSRQLVIAEAQRSGSSDLEMVFTALRARQERKRKTANTLKGAAGSRTANNTNRDSQDPAPKRITSVFDAMRAAEAELAEAL